jgi:chemotaxis protein methyltransferase CheR
VSARPLPDTLFERAGALFGARCGLRFWEGNRDLLENGLAGAAADEGCSPAALLDRLDAPGSEELMQKVLRRVTVGETYFFRHPEHFEALRERIIPSVIARRGERAPLRGWSAGCSSGEEAWSLALAMRQAAGPTHEVSVLGTDINRAALDVARRGLYQRWSIRGDLDGLDGREWSKGLLAISSDGTAAVGPELRAAVRFQYLNLRDPIYPSITTGIHGMDVVFCRNVLVYFFPDVARAVLARLYDAVADGGWLVLSPLDVDLAPEAFERVRHRGAILLYKNEARRAAPPPAPAPPPVLRCAPLAASHGPPHGPPLGRPLPAAEHDACAEARRAMRDAKAAADAGDLARATERARHAVGRTRLPEALHLLALILVEQGVEGEPTALLAEAVERAPDYVLAHLSLGLQTSAPSHLQRVLSLLAGRREEELLPGPDPLPVSWVRRMALAGLNRGERR